jgi:hypothetical protein
MENLAAQVFPQACRRNADAKHVKHCMWVWLHHGDELKVARDESKFIIHHSSFVIGVMPTERCPFIKFS